MPAPRRLRLCRVPGCGPLSEGNSRLSCVASMCDVHQAANAVELDGQLWRFCQPCLTMHTLDWFEGSKHVCRRHSDEYGGWRPTPYAGQANALARRGSTRATDANRGSAPPSGLLQMQAPWGLGLVDFMAGRTLSSKLALPVLYSATAFHMGWQQRLTWVVLGTTAAGLHALLPYLYKTHYLDPLWRLRKLAAKRMVSVSPALELITSNSDYLQLFQETAAQHASRWWLRDALTFVGLLWVCSSRVPVGLMANGFSVWSAFALPVVSSVVLASLRARAVSKGQHTRRQWVDMAADLYCRAGMWAPNLLEDAQHPQKLQGVGDLEFCVFCMVLEAVILLARTHVFENPLRWSIASETVVAVLGTLVLGPIGAAKLAEAGGMPASVYSLVPYTFASSLLVSSLVYVARRAKSEAGYLHAFLTREARKQHGPVERPRLGMSTKLLCATPEDLPWDLREQMLRLPEVEAESLEGFIRPGCVLLTLSYRFGDITTLDTARSAVLANLRRVSKAAEVPWAELDGVVTVGDTRFTVEGGEVVKEEAVLSPMIISVDRLALFDAETVSLQAMGLGSAPFSVLLRSGKEYLEVEVVCEQLLGDYIKQVTVRLPEFPEPGIAWLEVHSHASSSCPIVSDGFPIMFTWKEEIAAELSLHLPDQLPTTQAIASLLEDVAEYLAEGDLCRGPHTPAAPPSLLLEVVRLGLPHCFWHLAWRADILLETTESSTPDLLSAAVWSGSKDMLGMVIGLLKHFRLPVDPCRILPNSIDGFSPLHIAASRSDESMVAMLLEEMPDPEHQWHSLKAKGGSETPDELMKHRRPWFSVRDVIRNLPSSRAKAVWGTELIAALSLKTTGSRVGFPVAYSAALWAVGWREPLALVALALVVLGLHLLGPSLHKNLYVRSLQRVREVAKSCGLRVSQSLRILDANMQQAYEQHELQRSSCGGLMLAALLLPAACLPMWESWKLTGEVKQWMVTQAVVVLSTLTALRMRAVRTGSLAIWQWVDLAAWNYWLVMPFSHRVYLWATGSEVCALPASTLEAVAGHSLPMALVFATVVVFPSIAIWFPKVLLVSGPISREAYLLEPLFGMALVYLLMPTVDEWCLKVLNAPCLPAFLGHAVAALWLAGNMCYAGMRVRSEAARLRSFLTIMQQNVSSAKL